MARRGMRWWLGAVGAVLVVSVLLVLFLALTPLVLLVVGPPYVWAQVALLVKRARSMGLSPYLSVPLWLAFGPLDKFFESISAARMPWPFGDTSVWGAIYLTAILLALATCPPRSDARVPLAA